MLDRILSPELSTDSLATSTKRLIMGGGKELPQTPTKGKAPAAHHPETTPDAGPARPRPTPNRAPPRAADTHNDWDPIRDLGVFEVEWGQITCLGRTWGNKRCRRGPSATLNRPCFLHESPEIQECLQCLTDTPLIEVATTKTNLLQDLAEAMMCLNEPDGDSEWQGHALDQAAAQANVWRRRLARKAGLIRIPRTMRTEAYAMRVSKRDRDDEAPSPSSKRQATASGNEDDADEGFVCSQVSVTSQHSTGDPSTSLASSPESSPLRGRGSRSISALPKDKLIGGVRKMERDLQERDATIRDLEHELRIASEIIAQVRQRSSRATERTSSD